MGMNLIWKKQTVQKISSINKTRAQISGLLLKHKIKTESSVLFALQKIIILNFLSGHNYLLILHFQKEH